MWIKEFKLMVLVNELHRSGKSKDYILNKTNVTSENYEYYIEIGKHFKK